MTVLLYALGVLIFFSAILTSIGLHELGHMIPAKKFGGKVTQYFVGFGPTVWSKQVGETEYGVKAIPLGGYVKIVGMLPPGADDLVDSTEVDADGNQVQRIRKSNTSLFTQLVSDARAAEWELVKPEDSDRLFYKMAWWKKVVVMAGGPTVNLLIAFFLFWGVFSLHGVEGERQVDAGQPVIDSVSECVVPYADGARACRESDPKSPAFEIGLRPGDTVTEFNGTPITGWDQLRTLIRDNAQGEATISYERGDEVITRTTSTTVQARPDPDAADDEVLTQVGFLGVTPTSTVPITKGGPLFTLREMGTMTVETVKAIVTLPVKVYGVGEAIIGVEERAADSPVSIVGGGRFAGESTSSDVLTTSDKILFLVVLIAGFNLFIGLFNFVPLLPLDGGHIASALWEALRRGIARVRRRPDPGYVDAAKLLPVAYVVASILLVMGVILIIGDLVAPVATPY
ncbi:MAG: peptidase [Nocardioides sp.]|nr:peptidase [Nocardioides sp.]